MDDVENAAPSLNVAPDHTSIPILQSRSYSPDPTRPPVELSGSANQPSPTLTPTSPPPPNPLPTMSSQLNNPAQWATGADAPTDKQKGFISTLAASKNADINPGSLNKSEASQKINELKNAETKNPDAQPSAGAPIQDPKTWTTGDDPATGKQMGYVAVMAKEAGESVPEKMGKAEASGRIEELKGKTGM